MALTLKVMTYNIKSGGFGPGGLEALAQVISDQSPGLVGLQEVDRGRERSGFVDQARWLAERSGLAHHAFRPSFETKEGRGRLGGYGNAVLSRYPIAAVESRRLFRPEDWHASGAKWPPEPRSILATLVRVREVDLAFFCTHLGLLAEERIEQAREVLGFAQGWQVDAPVVLVGDFNAEAGSAEMTMLTSAFRSACEAIGLSGEARNTFPSGARGSRADDGWAAGIDDVLLGPGVELVEAGVVYDATMASDHNPVVATIRLEAKDGGKV